MSGRIDYKITMKPQCIPWISAPLPPVFEDLSFRDFASVGCRIAMRQQDYLAGNKDQVGILRRGVLLTDVNMADLSVQQSVVYTGMVGTMLAESHAAQDTEVGNCNVE